VNHTLHDHASRRPGADVQRATSSARRPAPRQRCHDEDDRLQSADSLHAVRLTVPISWHSPTNASRADTPRRLPVRPRVLGNDQILCLAVSGYLGLSPTAAPVPAPVHRWTRQESDPPFKQPGRVPGFLDGADAVASEWDDLVGAATRFLASDHGTELTRHVQPRELGDAAAVADRAAVRRGYSVP